MTPFYPAIKLRIKMNGVRFDTQTGQIAARDPEEVTRG